MEMIQLKLPPSHPSMNTSCHQSCITIQVTHMQICTTTNKMPIQIQICIDTNKNVFLIGTI